MKAEPSSTAIPMIKVNEVQGIIKLREYDLMMLRQNTKKRKKRKGKMSFMLFNQLKASVKLAMTMSVVKPSSNGREFMSHYDRNFS